PSPRRLAEQGTAGQRSPSIGFERQRGSTTLGDRWRRTSGRDVVMSPRKRAPWHGVCSRARQTNRLPARERGNTMVLFAIGLMAGIGLGVSTGGVLAIGAHDRCYREARERGRAR